MVASRQHLLLLKNKTANKDLQRPLWVPLVGLPMALLKTSTEAFGGRVQKNLTEKLAQEAKMKLIAIRWDGMPAAPWVHKTPPALTIAGGLSWCHT